MRAAEWGRQHSTPLPLAEILILQAAQHNAIDFLFELQRHAFLSDAAAAHLLSLAPSQFLTSERGGEVLVCSCCSSEAPRTSSQDKHSLSSGMWLLLLYALSGLDGWQPSVGRADAYSHRWADVPVGARSGVWAAYRGSGDTEIKGLWKVHRVSSELTPRRRLTVCMSFFLYVKSVPAVNQLSSDMCITTRASPDITTPWQQPLPLTTPWQRSSSHWVPWWRSGVP